MRDRPQWRLVNFEPHVDEWVRTDQPDQDLRNEVWAWIQSRLDDPFWASEQIADFPAGWRFAKLPATVRAGRIVVCTYFVDSERGTIACRGLASLPLPA